MAVRGSGRRWDTGILVPEIEYSERDAGEEIEEPQVIIYRLTDPHMTRFVMTLSEAVRLVLKSLRTAHGGEVFVTRMPVIRIVDLVEELIALVAPLYSRNPAKIAADSTT